MVWWMKLVGNETLLFFSTLCFNSIFTQILGTLCIVFIRFFLIVFRALKLLHSTNSEDMDGDRNRIEPFSCEALKKKPKVWKVLEKGGLTPYLERLHGNNPQTLIFFAKAWNNQVLKLGGTKFDVSEEFIENITSLLMDGMKNFRDKKESQTIMQIFFNGDEANDLKTTRSGGY